MKQSHIGIDLGKDSIMLSWPDAAQSVKAWPIAEISYKDDWLTDFLSRVDDGAIIVAEPTGISLITPIANVIKHHTTAQLYLVNHPTTGAVRQEHVGRSKTDEMDARTLALIATWVNTSAQPRSIRLSINSHRQLMKQQSRLKNQLEALGFSIWPALAHHKTTWLKCVDAGAITPAEIRWLSDNPPDHWNGKQKQYVHALANKLPDLPVHPATRTAILQRYTELASIEPAITTTQANLINLIDQPEFAETTAIWRSFPGSSDFAIAALHAACHGTLPSTYYEFRALIGTNPQGKSSGKSSKTKHSRSGYKPAAGSIHLWALFLISPKAPDNPIKKYAKSRDSFILAACRNKLAKILWTCATRKEPCKW